MEPAEPREDWGPDPVDDTPSRRYRQKSKYTRKPKRKRHKQS
jgi:hypothetical protein